MTLGIARTGRRVFEGSSALAADPALRGYLTDMVGPYGLAVRDEGLGHSYGEMAEPLIDALTTAETPVDLLIMVYGIHDVRLGRATATYLSSRCPGEPLAFALCDQGTAAAFTALQTINAYHCRRALLLVLEQSVLQYEPAGPAPIPERNAAVAFLLEDSASAQPVQVHQHANVDPDRVAEVLAREVEQLSGGRDTRVILDRDAPAGQPYTGTWWELSAALEDGRGPVLVAQYEPELHYLCVATCA